MFGKCIRAVAALVAAAALPLGAQPGGPVETRLESRKVVRAPDGRESFASAESARPGDVIEYALTYRNTGRQPVRNLQATLPIPAYTELVAGSPRPAAARASLDSQAFAEMPLKRRTVRDGREVEEAVPYSEYRYLRWSRGELAAREAATFTARVRVIE